MCVFDGCSAFEMTIERSGPRCPRYLWPRSHRRSIDGESSLCAVIWHGEHQTIRCRIPAKIFLKNKKISLHSDLFVSQTFVSKVSFNSQAKHRAEQLRVGEHGPVATLWQSWDLNRSFFTCLRLASVNDLIWKPNNFCCDHKDRDVHPRYCLTL